MSTAVAPAHGSPVHGVTGRPPRAAAAPAVAPRASFGRTLRFELVKMLSPWRVRGALFACLLGPAAFIGVVSTQATLPADTAFGRWMNQSGWAGALVVLGFCCSWVLPLLTSLVSGDAFAVEDRLGTWRHLVMAVRSPRRIFAAKALASLVLVELMVLVLALSAILGGLAFVGSHPLVGLDGQQIAPGRAGLLVLAAWGCCALATLAFAAVGLLGSVLMGRSPMGLMLPAVLALGLQLVQVLPLPVAVRMALPSQAFNAWRGLFTEPVQAGPLTAGVCVALLWTVAGIALALALFLRRDFTDLAYDGAARRGLVAGLVPLLLLVALVALPLALASHTPGNGVSRVKVERAMATSFAHLYRLQTRELGRTDATEAQLGTSASCDRGGDLVADEGPGNDWRCVVSWHLPGARSVGNAIYQLEVAPDGRIVADGDGPTSVNGYFPVSTPKGAAPNPLWQVDSLVDLLSPQ